MGFQSGSQESSFSSESDSESEGFQLNLQFPSASIPGLTAANSFDNYIRGLAGGNISGFDPYARLGDDAVQQLGALMGFDYEDEFQRGIYENELSNMITGYGDIPQPHADGRYGLDFISNPAAAFEGYSGKLAKFDHPLKKMEGSHMITGGPGPFEVMSRGLGVIAGGMGMGNVQPDPFFGTAGIGTWDEGGGPGGMNTGAVTDFIDWTEQDRNISVPYEYWARDTERDPYLMGNLGYEGVMNGPASPGISTDEAFRSTGGAYQTYGTSNQSTSVDTYNATAGVDTRDNVPYELTYGAYTPAIFLDPDDPRYGTEVFAYGPEGNYIGGPVTADPGAPGGGIPAGTMINGLMYDPGALGIHPHTGKPIGGWVSPQGGMPFTNPAEPAFYNFMSGGISAGNQFGDLPNDTYSNYPASNFAGGGTGGAPFNYGQQYYRQGLGPSGPQSPGGSPQATGWDSGGFGNRDYLANFGDVNQLYSEDEPRLDASGNEIKFRENLATMSGRGMGFVDRYDGGGDINTVTVEGRQTADAEYDRRLWVVNGMTEIMQQAETALQGLRNADTAEERQALYDETMRHLDISTNILSHYVAGDPEWEKFLQVMESDMNDLKGRITGDFQAALPEQLDPDQILRDTPGYQFRYDEGLKSAQQSLAARGLRGSGQAIEELQEWGQEFGAAEYNNKINQLMGITTSIGLPAQSSQAQIGSQLGLAGANAGLAAGSTFIRGPLTSIGQGAQYSTSHSEAEGSSSGSSKGVSL